MSDSDTHFYLFLILMGVVGIVLELSRISRRLKERFPTEEEQAKRRSQQASMQNDRENRA